MDQAQQFKIAIAIFSDAILNREIDSQNTRVFCRTKPLVGLADARLWLAWEISVLASVALPTEGVNNPPLKKFKEI